MSNETTQFVDEYWNVHERGVELGRGGQGVVFRTRDPDVAVKLALDGDGRPVVHAGYVERLRRVRALPVPGRLNLAAPMAVLQDTAGYAMRLLNNMVPFADFWPDPERSDRKRQLPEWLRAAPAELAGQLLCYRDSGSLERRLMSLHRCAAMLARLHGAGLVYGDVSPSNAFVSRDPASREVWLIDADNLRHETATAGRAIFTPGFGAPELVRGVDGGRARTDCHAFAVMAFWMLTLMHPFIGAYVEQGGEADWADDDAGGDADERAYAGLIAWIVDVDDDRNHKDNGLMQLVLNEELLALFQATFGPGRTRPWMRPSMFAWAVGLARAADTAITCPACRMGYHVDLADDGQRCPFCEEARPRLLVVDAHEWTGRTIRDVAPAWQLVRVLGSPCGATALPHRLFHPFSPTDGDRDVMEVSEDGIEVRLACCDVGHHQDLAVACDEPGHDVFAQLEGTSALPLAAVISRGFWIRVGGPSPRMLRCELRGGDR